MKTLVTTVAPGIYKFDTGPFNWYVIEDGGRLTLVDAGFVGHARILEEGLPQIGRDLQDVEALVLTHAHADHVGFAEKLRRRLKIPVYVHREDAGAARSRLVLPWTGLISNAWRPAVAEMLVHAVRNGVFWTPALERVEVIEDGETLDVPGRPTVIHTPGHTRGEVSFLLPDRRVLFAGDTLVTRGLLNGAHGAPVIPEPALSDEHAVAVASVQRLVGLGDLTILTGHGRPWSGSADEAVASALESAAKYQEPMLAPAV